MRQQFAWAGVLALAITTTPFAETHAGVIMISSRKNICADQGADNLDEKGPGMTTPGDVAMSTLLGNYGYSCRFILDVLIGTDPAAYLQPQDANLKIDLVIWSGSSSSADVPTPPPAIPLMMGEHVTLGNNEARLGSIFMYNGTGSNDPNESSTQPATKYLKVIAPDHPIMAGIPLDAQGRVKIFREPYPDEEGHVPTGGKRNFEYRWCTQTRADAAAGTTVLAVLDGAEDRTCLAVVDQGGMLANGQAATARMVHMFTNENGSGGSRRVFLALTDLAQIIFVRAAKWAMGDEVPRYNAIRITEVKPAGAQSIKLSWEASARHNYKIQASTDLGLWQTVVEDITGADGLLSPTLDLSAVPQSVFLRVARSP
ncbi:MAG: hypothetical protein L0Z50_06475 [Verrucomicrobiales bacterium]|nr:hypothetical protein [Verrucomicrobiales bacterium]